MASFVAKAKAGNDFAIKLSALPSVMRESVARRALDAGAEVVKHETEDRLKKVIHGPSTGALVESITIAQVKSTGDGYSVFLGFDGYDAKGVPNALKARVRESGRSYHTQPKRPFLRPAVKASKTECFERVGEVIDAEIAKIMNN